MDAIVDSYGKSTATWQHELYELLRRAEASPSSPTCRMPATPS